jgi:RND family efflux transporter MFP subunit
MARKYTQPLLVLLVLVFGFGTFGYFRSTKPEAERVERVSEGLLVEVERVTSADREVHVLAHGTVLPATRVVLQTEVSGRVVWKNPELVPGGRLKKGTSLLRIDARDYQLQLEARKAEVSRAELDLQLEQGRQQVARREWELFGEKQKQGTGSEPAPIGPKQDVPAEGAEDVLALRGPQMRTAQVGVQSANSALDRAKLDLARTQLQAPFNALVVDEQVNVGQLVSPNAQLATLVGTDTYWVQVSIPVEALAYVAVPGTRGNQEGSPARVSQKVGGERVERPGRVVRLLPDLDAGGAMARLLVEIQDPLGLELPGNPLPVLINSYVDVDLAAKTLENVVEVPRAGLREGDRAYVVDADGRLRIRELKVAWRYPQSVLVERGLADGDEVIVSRIAAPVEGMPVRKATKASAPQAEGKAAQPEPTGPAKSPAPETAQVGAARPEVPAQVAGGKDKP